MKYDYKVKCIKELTDEILKEGLRVFVSHDGTYGFYTDNIGDRIVSFQFGLTLAFCGNYKSERNGTGWRIREGKPDNFRELLSVHSPFEHNKYTSLAEYLKTYQKYSKFKEII